MNDPNGLVHVDGVWHLFYQHHPADLLWGPMHWGHATSTDLVHWQHQPIALTPDRLGAAFSGSAVVDRDGVAGFGPGALLAFYTHFLEDVPQSQGVAASTDGGRAWQPYDGNPVLRAPEGLVDFRDPKAFWYDDDDGDGGGSGHWVMVLVGGDEVIVYRSGNLLQWTESGRFGRGCGAHGGVWETPDLIELPLPDGGSRWILVVSVLGGGPAGGTGTQYFIGAFDGETFRSDDPPDTVRWVDHGADFYAPQSWSGAPQGRRVWLAWMSNWDYARTTPASIWRGAMTVPREVSLLRGADGGWVLAQRPVPELTAVGRVVEELRDVTLDPEGSWQVEAAPRAYDVQLRWDAEPAGAVVVEVHAGARRGTRIVYSAGEGVLRVARPVDGIEGASPDEVQEVRVGSGAGFDLRVVVDTCSVEVFADGGRAVLTNQVFPARGQRELRIIAEGGGFVLAKLVLSDLG